MDEARLRRAAARVGARLAAQKQSRGVNPEGDEAALKQLQDTSLMPDFMDNVQQAIGGGMAKAVFETKDFLFGEPAEADKSTMRRSIEGADRALDKKSIGYSLTSGVSQFAVGLIGAGKAMAPVKALQKLRSTKAGVAAYESARGAIAGATVIDPHEERLSDLIESFPDLQNPVTEFLAADPTDSAAEGRMKNALEGIGVDATLLMAIKAFKWLKAGNQEMAAKEITKLEEAEIGPATSPGQNFTELPTQPASKDEPAQPLIGKQAVAKDEPVATAASPTQGQQPMIQPEGPGGTPAPEAASPPLQPRQLVEVTPETVRDIIKGTSDDLAAIKTHGSREAALEAGAALARGVRLPWQKLRTGTEVQSFLDNATSSLKAQMDTVKGGDILSDGAVSARVHEMAEQWGEAPELILGEIAQAGEAAAGMVARMEAGFLVSNAMTQDAFTTATKIRNGVLQDWGGDAVKATEELRAQIKGAATLLAHSRSMASNSGRALRRLRGSFQITPEDLARIDSLDATQLADLMTATKGDPKKLTQAVSPGFLRRVTDEATFLLQNNLLWLWPTHLMNVTSSALMIAGRPLEKLLGSFATGPSTGNIMRQQALKEYAYTMSSLSDGWTAAVEAFKRGDSILAPHNTELFQGASSTSQRVIEWQTVESVSDLVENVFRAAHWRNLLGLPTRSLGAMDEFFKMLRYRATVQARAAVEASERGLTGADITDYVSKKLEAALDPATGRALDPKALREAQVTTFQQELLAGTWGASTQQLRGRHPLLGFVLPFIKTPVNVWRYGIKLTPGLNMAQREFRDALRGLQGEEARVQAVGQMALGSIFMSLTAVLALDGRITGPGPTDHSLRQQLTATGWQPFSFVLEGAGGRKTYVPIGRADPAGMAFSTVATLVEAMRMDPDGTSVDLDTGIWALAVALSKNLSDRSFLANIHQALQALTDPGARGERWLGNLGGNLLPASSLLRGTNPDPYMREAQGLVDTMLKSVPGYSETLPPVRNFLGEPVARRVGLLTDQDADVVEAENNRIILETGGGVRTPSPNFEDVDLRDIWLTEGDHAGRTAYDRYQELAGQIPGQRSLKEFLRQIIESDLYQELPDGDAVRGTRLGLLTAQVDRYRGAARKYLIRENAELQPLVKARQRQAAAARQEKRRQKQGSSIQDIPGLNRF
ncbi:hypothetical protein ASC75_05065 [Aminobacter sp. DSM 101952]|uniref:hypothetical protein n=1 Tax=Aminobacter sp. DSM 101952 TaxID=2735891 RepID=UPI000713249C|nr:hypothetical protein [Aminobacter sp. DSM 101952]KQU73032.1 hypothetical protein ASC75_05065 [Aminobacter sp. DSM 101952]